MTTLKLYTGPQGDHNSIMIDWFDENNERHTEIIEIIIQDQDKPRTLEIKINSEVVVLRR